MFFSTGVGVVGRSFTIFGFSLWTATCQCKGTWGAAWLEPGGIFHPHWRKIILQCLFFGVSMVIFQWCMFKKTWLIWLAAFEGIYTLMGIFPRVSSFRCSDEFSENTDREVIASWQKSATDTYEFGINITCSLVCGITIQKHNGSVLVVRITFVSFHWNPSFLLFQGLSRRR